MRESPNICHHLARLKIIETTADLFHLLHCFRVRHQFSPSDRTCAYPQTARNLCAMWRRRLAGKASLKPDARGNVMRSSKPFHLLALAAAALGLAASAARA